MAHQFAHTDFISEFTGPEQAVIDNRAGAIFFPTKLSFAIALPVAIGLLPQRDADGNPLYLFGKGAGLELSVQGQVHGRAKRVDAISYRSHSDLELYGCRGVPYAPDSQFVRVFEPQEYFETTKTSQDKTGQKSNLYVETDELLAKCEIVTYGGNDYLVPQLETQFVDKLLDPGVKHRPEGEDAFVLAMTYALDRSTVTELLDRRSATKLLGETKFRDNWKTQQRNAVEDVFKRGIADGATLSEAHSEFDDLIVGMTGGNPTLSISRVTLLTWQLIDPTDIDEAGNLGPGVDKAIDTAFAQLFPQPLRFDRSIHERATAVLDAADTAAREVGRVSEKVTNAAPALSCGLSGRPAADSAPKFMPDNSRCL